MKRKITITIIISMIIILTGGKNAFSQYPTQSTQNDSIISEYLDEVNVDSVESYIQFLQDMGTRFMIAPNRKSVAEAIKEKFLTLGVPEVRIDSFYCTTVISYSNIVFDTVTTQYNVIATIPGITDFDQFCVMGAHYDCVVAPEGDPMVYAPGADDNASGVSALFEVARILSLKEYEPFRSIELVAFAAEELMYFGNSGGQAYVDSALAHDVNIEMMINNDMIAYTGTDDWKITISNYLYCEWLTLMAEEIVVEYTIIEPLVRELSSQAGADCKYFYEAGIPCVYFMEDDFNPFYHTVNDLIGNADMDYCTEAVKISLGLLLDLDDWVVSTPEPGKELTFNIFPNPTSGKLNIKAYNRSFDKPMQYTVVNAYGQVVMEGLVENSIDMIYLPDGIYFCLLKNESGAQTTKIIKMK